MTITKVEAVLNVNRTSETTTDRQVLVSLFIHTITTKNSLLSTSRRKVCRAAAKSCPIDLNNFALKFGECVLVGPARKHVTSTSCSCCHSALDGRTGKLLRIDRTINTMEGDSSVANATNSSCISMFSGSVEPEGDFWKFCAACAPRNLVSQGHQAFSKQTLPYINL